MERKNLKLTDQKTVVCEAGDFIGGHIASNLLANGIHVIAESSPPIKLKPEYNLYAPNNVNARKGDNTFTCEPAMGAVQFVA